MGTAVGRRRVSSREAMTRFAAAPPTPSQATRISPATGSAASRPPSRTRAASPTLRAPPPLIPHRTHGEHERVALRRGTVHDDSLDAEGRCQYFPKLPVIRSKLLVYQLILAAERRAVSAHSAHSPLKTAVLARGAGHITSLTRSARVRPSRTWPAARVDLRSSSPRRPTNIPEEPFETTNCDLKRRNTRKTLEKPGFFKITICHLKAWTS